ncbi:MAG: hypothetical protein AAFR61_22975 [Bacteroidota bacterium]
MVNKETESRIMDYLRLLNKSQQTRVLSYIKTLISLENPHPTSNKQALLKWAGSIDPPSLKEMESAIDEAFNQVDLNEW